MASRGTAHIIIQLVKCLPTSTSPRPTLREAAFGLGDEPGAGKWAAQARQKNPPTWTIESTDAQIEKLRQLLVTIAAKPKE